MAARVTVEGISAEDVAGALGPTITERGLRYARDGAVLFAEWRAHELQLRAVVRGGEGQVYSTVVHFDADGYGGLELADGECSCPVGQMCKSVAAAALSAVPPGPVAALPAAPAWETTLEALLGPSTAAPPRPTGALGIELTPDGAGGLMARLVRPGSNGWVYGGLLWNRMLQPAAAAGHPPRALARELYLLRQAARSGSGFSPYRYFGYGADEKQIDLTEISSPRLWSLLDAAADAGLHLLPARHRLGPLPRPGLASLSLDVTAGTDGGSLAIRPVLRFAGADAPDSDAVPVAFLGGDTAHGVATVSAAENLA